MKVDVLSRATRSAGGLFYSVRGLSKALQQHGCIPRVLSPDDEFAQEDRGVWDPLPVEFYKTFGPLQSSMRLRQLLASSDSDLIHLHGIWLDNQWAALDAQRRRGVPVVVSPRGMLDPWAVKNAAWKKKLAGALFADRALQHTTVIHALCRSEVESIRAYGLKNPVALIPNGVELPERVERKTVDGERKLLFLGRLHPKKGLQELLQAWARFSGDWKLIVAGWDDGGHEESLKAISAALGISEKVEFAGAKYGPEKDALLRSVDAFILPSFSEGLPMSVLEAWSYGLPVVMTDYCNIPEGFSADAALRVEPDADSILTGLEALSALSAGELLDRGARGRRLAEEKFSWDVIAGDMKQVYEWCIGCGELPVCMTAAERI